MALAIVVLLVYVANPPVSDAIQGAYFVAAFVPACIIGVLALVFKDLVEGLGCLLGGFCFSMWLLCLKDGSLIPSTGGRIGLIVGLSVAGFALSFSHYTRTYGLIACLSFAGATAFILGVDCFSRAGLKEFWIYVWSEYDVIIIRVVTRADPVPDLNENIFPLGTTTYPLTRGIKVEVACIIVLAVFGSMSQMKLWKIIREKRDKRAAARAQDEEERETLETNLGKRLEDRNNKELAQWEATYGGTGTNASASALTSSYTSLQDSPWQSNRPSISKVPLTGNEKGPATSSLSVVTPRNGSLQNSPYQSRPASVRKASATDSATELVEMTDMSRSARRSSRDGTVIAAPEEVHFPADSAHVRGAHIEALRALEPVREQPSPTPSRPMSYVVTSNNDEGHWEEPTPAGPEVTPLPFTVPTEKLGKPRDDDARSIATAGDDVQGAAAEPAARKSRQTILRIANKRTSGTTNTDEEDDFSISVPHLDDARSSIAATLDGLSEDGHSDLPALSRSGTPLPTLEPDTVHKARKARSASSLLEILPRVEVSAPASDDANRRHSVHLGQLLPDSKLGSLGNLPGSNATSEKSSDPPSRPKRLSQDSSAATPGSGKSAALTKDVLPESQSSTVLLYRTNEWAKHQAVAEALSPDEIAPPSESGVAVAYGAEASAPVDVAALSQNAFHPAPPSIARSSTQVPARNPSKKTSQDRRHSSDSMQNLPRSNSTTSVNRSASQSSLHRNFQRSPSNPILSPANPYSPGTIVESPVEETQAEAGMYFNNVGAMTSTNTLMGQRQTMLNGRISAMSFASPDAPTHSARTIVGQTMPGSQSGGIHDDVPLSSRRRQTVNEEDMTLAQRKAALQQPGRMQRSPSALASANPYRNYSPKPPTVQRSVSQQYSSPASQMTVSNPRMIYDSHQPQRGNTVSHSMRENRLASWRASVAQDPIVNSQGNASRASLMDDSRARIIDEQRRAGEARAFKDAEAQRRSSAIDLRMRQGDMVALHREKLRKLQRQASQTE